MEEFEKTSIVCIGSQAGISRSATIVLAYLMTIGDYDVEKALQIVKGARGFIQPNPGFLSQLKRYHSNDVKKVERQICYICNLMLVTCSIRIGIV